MQRNLITRIFDIVNIIYYTFVVYSGCTEIINLRTRIVNGKIIIFFFSFWYLNSKNVQIMRTIASMRLLQQVVYFMCILTKTNNFFVSSHVFVTRTEKHTYGNSMHNILHTRRKRKVCQIKKYDFQFFSYYERKIICLCFILFSLEN